MRSGSDRGALRLHYYAYRLQLHYAIIAVTYRIGVGTYGVRRAAVTACGKGEAHDR